MKECYSKPESNITEFSTVDVITTSALINDGNTEDPFGG